MWAVIIVAAMSAATAQAADPSAQTVLPDGTVRFASGSSDLTPESQRTLERLAGILKRRPELDPVLLVGHADDRGSPSTNVVLSKSRAEVVKSTLVGLGVRARRLETRGAGSAEPLVAGGTDEARQTNRRVEVWITPQDAVATVGRIERTVKSKEASAPKWRRARVAMPLRRLAQVRTMKRSSTEIRFDRDDRVGLGPEALVVIFGTPSRTKQSRRRVADIAVRGGSIFASLAKREGRQIDVETRAGHVEVRSKKTRIDVPAKKKVSRVSVFEGASRVSGAGKTVDVKGGWGTRVTEGEVPEPPRPLPPPPVWTDARTIETFVGEPTVLAWRSVASVPAAEVQVGAASDQSVERPIRLERVDGASSKLQFDRSGVFHVRIAGIDDRDIRGGPSRSRRIVVWPRPDPHAIESGAIRVTSPATAVLSAPAGTVVAFAPSTTATTSTTTALAPAAHARVDLVRPGTHVVRYSLSSTTGVSHRGRLRAVVATASVTAPEPLKMHGVDGRTVIDGRVRVVVGSTGVPGLELHAGTVPEMTPRLGTTELVACRCAAPTGAVPVVDEGDGFYRFSIAAPEGRGPVVVRLVDARGPVAVELTAERPAVSMTADRTAPTKRNGWFGGLSSGVLLGVVDAPTLSLGVEAGHRLRLARSWDLDLGARAGWFSRTEPDEASVDVFVLGARATASWIIGVPRLYAGAGAGGRWTSPSSDTAFAAEAILGLGYAIGEHGELRVEASVDDSFDGFFVTIGFRLGTWRLVL